MPIKKIPSEELEVGMYVSNLDRPWTETPFMFQGFELHNQQEIDELRQHTRNVYVIVPDEEIELTRRPSSHDETAVKTDALHQVNYNKPVHIDKEIKRASPDHQQLSRLFKELKSHIHDKGTLPFELMESPARKLVDSVTSNPDAYIWLTRLKKFDSFLYKDALTSAVWATALGRRLGLSEQQLHNLAIGCLLFDVGKMCLPEELLHKEQRLGDNEWEQMKSHVELGVNLLARSGNYPDEVIQTVRTHHERLNGAGYPLGLEGSQIPLFGQIAGIVDQYVAVTSPRPYAEVLSPSKAEEMLYKQRGQLFDEMLVEYFIQALSTYPTGSLVELSSGEVGIVKAQKHGHNLRPDIILLLNPEKQPYGSYTLVSLDNYTISGQPVSIRRTLADGDYGIQIEELAL
ncbi:MAG: HD-GYP domain-containing protein [Pseudomonadota bacterium]|nr:HD-GYP domain-containing protein [Pseudomonadota bacterium]